MKASPATIASVRALAGQGASTKHISEALCMTRQSVTALCAAHRIALVKGEGGRPPLAAPPPPPPPPDILRVGDSPGVECFIWPEGVPSHALRGARGREVA